MDDTRQPNIAEADTSVHEVLDHARRLRGLHREVWEGLDTDEYIRQERDAWERQ